MSDCPKKVISDTIAPTENQQGVRIDIRVPLESLSLDELYKILHDTNAVVADDLSIESIGNQLYPKYWISLKREFHIFLCTNDEKYFDIRKRLSGFGSGSKSEVAIVSTIAAAVGQQVGMIAGALVPFGAICLIAVLKLGIEAFCRAHDLDVRVGP